MHENLPLSIIVTTHNSKNTIEACLGSIRDSKFLDYELIVVDDNSIDGTDTIAYRYTKKVIKLSSKCGRSCARRKGITEAKGQIIVNIDSDIKIRPNTLNLVYSYFLQHQDIHAVTGILSKEHKNKNFFSQYKNLYMHYIFKKLPERVMFLYGSIYALRLECARLGDADIKLADDTALGQKLVFYGKKIAFLKDLEVEHLKKYDFLSFIKNDFLIPFDWAKIFIRYKGWKQLGRHNIGYAHSPKEQLISLIISPLLLMLILLKLFNYPFLFIESSLILAWLIFNLRFILFLIKEKGFIFGIIALFVTFMDNIIMALGIFSGFATSLLDSVINT